MAALLAEILDVAANRLGDSQPELEQQQDQQRLARSGLPGGP